MTLSAIFILDSTGKILIWRDYRGDVKRELVQDFLQLVHEQEDSGLVRPVLYHEATTLAYVKHNGLFIVAATKRNANVGLVFTFIHKTIEIATRYFDILEEESIRDNFVVLYELLDEIMDFGYPQITDSQILRSYIFEGSYRLKKSSVVPAVVTNVVSWRPEGIEYKKNELFVDVIESVNLTINSKGSILFNEISGCVKMKVHLSGMPQLRLGLSDKILSHNAFEDFKFHQCVQLSRITDRNVYFIPPDGTFELMSYRMSTDMQPLVLVQTKVEQSSSRIEYLLKANCQFKASSFANVQIILPVHQDVDTPSLKASSGTATYHPEHQAVMWKLMYFFGGSESVLSAQFQLSSIRNEEVEMKKPVRVKFMIPYFTVSGLQIKYMKVIERSNYKALTWVRYTTRNGEYLISFN